MTARSSASHTTSRPATDADRIVVTGTGVRSALGSSPEELAENLRQGETGVSQMTQMDPDLLPSSHAAEVSDFDPDAHFSVRDQWKLDRSTQLALLAGRQALDRAGLGSDAVPPKRLGLAVGMAGSVQYDNLYVSRSRSVTPSRLAARFFARSVPRMQTDVLSHRLGAEGPRVTYSIASAGSGLAIDHAAALLRSGRADAVLAGGGETLSILNVVGMGALGVTADGVSSPFSGEPGISFGEAAGFVVLETREHARRRGADVRAEVQGTSVTADAYDPIRNDPSGVGLHRAMAQALDRAGLAADRLDWIKASGTGNRQQDVTETAAIEALFDDRNATPPPASSLESAYGHPNGISPVLGFIAAIQAHQHGFIPPTVNFQTPRSGCTLDYVPNDARSQDVDRFLVNGIGFGGINVSVASGPPDNGATPTAPCTSDVVVTGCGLVSPIGHGVSAFVDGLRDGQCGLTPLEDAPDDVCARRAGVVDLTPRDVVPRLSVRRVPPMNTYALTAGALALDRAGLRGADEAVPSRMGVLAGQSRGPVEPFAKLLRSIFAGRPSGRMGKLLLGMGRFSLATRLANQFDLRGYAGTIDEGITGGLHGLVHGTTYLRQHPELDALVVVSADAFCDLFYRLYDRAGVLSRDGFSPYASRDAQTGMTLAEGAVAVVLERRRSAQERGAEPVARVTGAGTATESSPPFDASERGAGIRRATERAVADADAAPASIDAVYGHGRGAPRYDRAEVQAMRRVFDRPVPAGCVNGHVGVAEAASGLFSTAAALASIQHDEVYPLVSDRPPADTAPLDFAARLRASSTDRVLVAGGTESGTGAAVILDAPAPG